MAWGEPTQGLVQEERLWTVERWALVVKGGMGARNLGQDWVEQAAQGKEV